MFDAISAETQPWTDDLHESALDPDEGPGEAMRELHARLSRVAPSAVPVLVTGETGAGKEGVIRKLHEASGRRGPLVILNCGTIPHALIASTLFGHERGAFTGAVRSARGAFEQAQGGTLCLDEVAELPADAQAALLRALETGSITRVGGEQPVALDVRLISASHRDLGALVQAGSFRADLWYRLNAVTLRVPPLRERPGELRSLVRQFLDEVAAAQQRLAPRVERDVWFALRQHSWPGNIRELRNVIVRAATLCDDAVIRRDDLPECLRGAPTQAQPWCGPVDLTASFAEQIRQHEIALLRAALRRTGGCKSSAARVLRMPRRTLMRKVKLYRL